MSAAAIASSSACHPPSTSARTEQIACARMSPGTMGIGRPSDTTLGAGGGHGARQVPAHRVPQADNLRADGDLSEIVETAARRVRLSLGGAVYDPTDPVGRLLFDMPAMVAEFEADLIPPPHPGRHENRAGQGTAARQAAEAQPPPGNPPGRATQVRRNTPTAPAAVIGHLRSSRGLLAPSGAEVVCQAVEPADGTAPADVSTVTQPDRNALRYSAFRFLERIDLAYAALSRPAGRTPAGRPTARPSSGR